MPPEPTIEDVVTSARRYLLLPDDTVEHVVVALAGAVSKQLLDEEPLWLLFIAPPSSGKTEAIRLLDDLADARVDDLTRAGLLSWHTAGKRSRRTGLLTKIPRDALVTVSDFSSVVTMGDREARARMFGMLRVVYDGRVRRSIGGEPSSEGEGELEWEGHLTLLAAATPAIDAHTSHEAALGERWISYRLPETDKAVARERAMFAMTRSDVGAHRQEARALAAELVHAARKCIPSKLTDDSTEQLLDAATFVATARTGVTFEGQGRSRVIVEAPVPEEPTRLAQQLHRLARCLVALGIPESAAVQTAIRTGIYSMSTTREQSLLQLLLAGDDGATVSDVHRAIGRGSRWGAIWQLDCLEAIGMLDVHGPPRDEDPHATRHYTLRPEWLETGRKMYTSVASHSLVLSKERVQTGDRATHAYTPTLTEALEVA